MPFRELARFGIWWLWVIPVRLLRYGWDFFLATDNNLQLATNLKLWLMFEPMFGDYDWKGHVIGFFLRGVRTFATLLTYIVVLGFCLALPLSWYALMVLGVISIFSK